VLRAAGKTEITQENIRNWFELLTEEEIAAVIFFYLLPSALPILLNFTFTYFIIFFCLLGLSFDSLIRIIA
jgi:hypothetical protein